jgi:hypothetical protein
MRQVLGTTIIFHPARLLAMQNVRAVHRALYPLAKQLERH